MKKILIIVGVLFVLFIVIAIPKYLRDLRVAQNKLSVYAPNTVDTSIAPIEYIRTGNGYPILVSHGITGGYDQGLGLAENYISGEYDIISVSRFGYLGSPIPDDSSPNAQADVYKLFLDKLNIEKTFVFGNSAGGTSALKFAMKYPERCKGLILVSSNIPSNVTLPPKPLMKMVFGSDMIYWSTVNIMGERMLLQAGVTKASLDTMTRQEKDDLIGGILMSGFPISSRTNGVINDMFVSNPDINNDYNFEQIKVPVLIISAKDDPLCAYDGALEVSKRIKNSELVSFEDGGHLLLDHEIEIQERIAQFIDQNTQ